MNAYYKQTAMTWLKESYVPFAMLVKKDLLISGDSPDAERNMDTILECARDHAYNGAKHEIKNADADAFDDAWNEALAEINKQLGE